MGFWGRVLRVYFVWSFRTRVGIVDVQQKSEMRFAGWGVGRRGREGFGDRESILCMYAK